ARAGRRARVPGGSSGAGAATRADVASSRAHVSERGARHRHQVTESRKARASPAIVTDSSIGRIGGTGKITHGVLGADIVAIVFTLSASTIINPPAPSAVA